MYGLNWCNGEGAIKILSRVRFIFQIVWPMITVYILVLIKVNVNNYNVLEVILKSEAFRLTSDTFFVRKSLNLPISFVR